jgi:hypothetical protein
VLYTGHLIHSNKLPPLSQPCAKPENDAVLYSGYLDIYREDRKGSLFKPMWSRRWFELISTNLYEYHGARTTLIKVWFLAAAMHTW